MSNLKPKIPKPKLPITQDPKIKMFEGVGYRV
jgi:hypothetical protein